MKLRHKPSTRDLIKISIPAATLLLGAIGMATPCITSTVDASPRLTSTPSVSDADTALHFNFKGLNGQPFDMSLLPERLEVGFFVTDSSNRQRTIGSTYIDRKDLDPAKVHEVRAGWPLNLTQNDSVSAVVWETRSNPCYMVAQPSSYGEAGKLHFTFNFQEIHNLGLTFAYKDCYGDDLSDDLLPADTSGYNVHLALGEGIDLPILKSNRSFHLADVAVQEETDPLVQELGGLDALNAVADNVDAVTQLTSPEYVTIQDKTTGTVAFKNKENKPTDYGYKISYSKEKGTLITLTHQPKVAIPTPDEHGRYPQTPAGYTRLTFHADTKNNDIQGSFEDDQHTQVLDVRSDVAWNDEELANITRDLGNPSPYKKGSSTEHTPYLRFMGYKPAIPTTAETVQTTEFYAEYQELDRILYYEPATKDQPASHQDANMPKKDSSGKNIDMQLYTVVAYRVQDPSQGFLTADTQIPASKQASVISALVRKDLQWAEISRPEPHAKEGFEFNKWDQLPVDTHAVEDGTVLTALFNAQQTPPAPNPQPNKPTPQAPDTPNSDGAQGQGNAQGDTHNSGNNSDGATTTPNNTHASRHTQKVNKKRAVPQTGDFLHAGALASAMACVGSILVGVGRKKHS